MPILKGFGQKPLNGTATAIISVTKDDANDLPDGACFGLTVGTAGDANLIDASGNTLTSYPLQQGYNPISIKRVKLGGTATNIWALY